MPEYRVVLARSAERELRRLSPEVVGRVVRAVDRLRTEPRPPGARKLSGQRALWRVRAGDYRIVYQVDDDARLVDVAHIRHRREAYE